MKRKPLNFWQTSWLISPIAARLVARIPYGRPLNDAEISQRSGLALDRVFIIQHLTDWSHVGFVEAERYLVGCGVDFCNRRQVDRVRAFLRRRPSWKFLRMSPEWETKFKPLLLRYRESLRTITK